MSELDPTRHPAESNHQSRGAGPRGRSNDRLRRVVEGEILPRFLETDEVDHAAATPASPSLADEFSEFMELVRSADPRARLDDYLDSAVEDGHDVETIFEDLLTPVARRMGVLWEEDECDFFEVTVVCTRLQAAIRRLGARFHAKPTKPRGRILVGGIPGAEHSLGFLMVAETFAREGYLVELGEPLVHGIHPSGFDIMAVSVTRTEEADRAKEYITRAKGLGEGDMKVIVGGFAFRSDPGLVKEIGADGWADDAESALRLVDQMLNPESATVSTALLSERRPRA